MECGKLYEVRPLSKLSTGEKMLVGRHYVVVKKAHDSEIQSGFPMRQYEFIRNNQIETTVKDGDIVHNADFIFVSNSVCLPESELAPIQSVEYADEIHHQF